MQEFLTSMNNTAVVKAIAGVDAMGRGEISGVTYTLAINIVGQQSYEVDGMRPIYRPVQDGTVIQALPVGLVMPVLHMGATILIDWTTELPPIGNCP